MDDLGLALFFEIPNWKNRPVSKPSSFTLHFCLGQLLEDTVFFHQPDSSNICEGKKSGIAVSHAVGLGIFAFGLQMFSDSFSHQTWFNEKFRKGTFSS